MNARQAVGENSREFFKGEFDISNDALQVFLHRLDSSLPQTSKVRWLWQYELPIDIVGGEKIRNGSLSLAAA